MPDFRWDIAEKLQQLGWMLATAESCTGGLIAGACTDLAGSSAWFERGFVTYSNAAKTELLGVDATLIERFGAVSEPVARAMAEGALRHSPAQVSVAVTGIAGPSGGSAEKPVGTVWFGWSLRGAGGELHTRTEHRRFAGDRNAVRAQTVAHALAGVLRRVAGAGQAEVSTSSPASQNRRERRIHSAYRPRQD